MVQSPSLPPCIRSCSGWSARGWWFETAVHLSIFSPPQSSQAEILGQELSTLADRLGSESIAPLIMQLIHQKRLSRKEAAEIRKLLDKYTK